MSMGHENRSQDEQPQARPADWDSLKEEVGDAADAAVERGRNFLDAAREQATVYVDARKDAVAQSVADFATSLRTSTASFEDRPNIRAVADSAAEGLDQLADSIRQRSFAEIFSEGERLVRDRPGTVAAVTLVLGFVAARFIKASADTLRDEHRLNARSGYSRERRSSGGPRRAS